MRANRGITLILLVIAVIVVTIFWVPRSWLLAGLTVSKPLAKSEAIVLVGGGFQERAPAAAMLYRDGYAPLVILANDGVFSGWSTKYNRNLYQVEWAEEELFKLGVPRDHIIKLPFYGSSTMFDALAVKRYLLKSGLKKIIVVTSDYHTLRALWTFKNVLKAYTSDITIFPAISFGIGARSMLLECVKIGYYLLRYGMFGMMPQMIEVQHKKTANP